jgi:hypothetical protein
MCHRRRRLAVGGGRGTFTIRAGPNESEKGTVTLSKASPIWEFGPMMVDRGGFLLLAKLSFIHDHRFTSFCQVFKN